MSNPLLAFGLVLAVLLVLNPQPTRGFTVKFEGNDNTFGEEDVPLDMKDKTKVPIGPDVFPDPSGNDEEEGTSEEVFLEVLSMRKPMTEEEIDDYLKRFGYLTVPVNGPVSENEKRHAIKEFQRLSSLKETGVVDTQTMRQMQKSRCGLADPVTSVKLANFDARKTRKWQKKDLTYAILVYSKKISKSIVQEWVAKSFKMWADVSQLTFTEVDTEAADIRIKFTPREHGDGAPFDGSGGVLAHAFFPRDGRVHMDEAEKWTVKTREGINLFFVLVHEIGHALGLGHSKVQDAVMEPYYNGYDPNLKLNADDIAGIQFLYGKPKTAPPKPQPPTKRPNTPAPPTKRPNTPAPPTKRPNTPAPPTKRPYTPSTRKPYSPKPTTPLPGPTDEPLPPARKFPCPFRYWAIMAIGSRTVGFRGRFIYEINEDGRATKRTMISSAFRRGPRYVGAAAYNEASGHFFLFAGRVVWRYTDKKLDSGFPKRLDFYARAAVVVDGDLVVFSFAHVHILDEDTMVDYVDGELETKDEYPGLPAPIKAAVSYGDGLSYIMYRNKAIHIDLYTGEILEEVSCERKRKWWNKDE